jgi:hypothetical protein
MTKRGTIVYTIILFWFMGANENADA